MDGDTFEFTYTPDTALTATTRIALPAGTWSVQCEGGRATLRDGGVELVAHGEGDVHVRLKAASTP